MKTIWKFPLQSIDRQSVQMPQGAEILTVQTQRGQPCLWAIVDDVAPMERRVLEIFGTGHEIHEEMETERKYIGTFQLMSGDLVFHVFERIS